jgi:hypothetical protein
MRLQANDLERSFIAVFDKAASALAKLLGCFHILLLISKLIR